MVDDSQSERPPGGQPPQEPPPGGDPYYDPTMPQPTAQGRYPQDSYAQYPPAGPEPERDRTPLVIGAIALVAALAAIVIGIAALASDDSAAPPDGAVSGSISVGTDDLEDESVTSVKLAPEAVGTGRIANGAVTDEKLAEGAVTGNAIADGAVTSEKLADDVLGDSDIPDGSVTSKQLAEGAVERPNIAEGAIAGRKVADDSLGGQQIDESTLDTVPAAETAAVAEVALALEGGGEGGSSVQFDTVQASSDGGPAGAKGPVVATCADGDRVVGGGASIVGPEGTLVPVALSASTTSGNGWAGSAIQYAESEAGWRLDVVAVCASG